MEASSSAAYSRVPPSDLPTPLAVEPERRLTLDESTRESRLSHLPLSTRDATVLDINGPTEPTTEELAKVEEPVRAKVIAPPRTVFLNGLRGLAALLVCHVHAGLMGGMDVAPVAVDVFFVLSAFLLTMLNEAKFRKLQQRKASVREWAVTLADYFVKRLLRVYPLFAATVLVLTIMKEETRTHYYNLAHYNIKQWSAWDVLTFKKRYYLFWTMPIEITYYFIIPVYVGVMCVLRRYRWLLVLGLTAWVYYEGGQQLRGYHDRFRLHVSTFVAGSLGATVYGGVSRWIHRSGFEFRLWHVVLVRLLEGTMLLSIMSDTFHMMLHRWVHGSMFLRADVAVVGLPMAVVIVIEMLLPSPLSRALEWNFLCYAGKVSFSMYLLHPFIVFQPWLQAWPYYDEFFTRLALIFTLATVSYYVVEYPCQKLANYLGKQLQKLNKPAPDYHQPQGAPPAA